MKINDINGLSKPEIIVDVTGKAIFVNDLAKKIFQIKIGDYVSKIVDINAIKKKSMYSDVVDVQDTLHPEYKSVTMEIFDNSLIKTIRLTFFKGYNKTIEDEKKEKDILAVINNVRLYNKKAEILMDSFALAIKESVIKSGHFINLNIKESSFYGNKSVLQALVLNSVAMLNEISPTKPVDLYISKIQNVLQIKIIVRVEKKLEARGIQEIEDLCPGISSLRITLIDNICEKNEIDYSINLIERSMKIIFKIKEIQSDGTPLGYPIPFISDWEKMAILLAPKSSYSNINYDISATEQEE